MKEEQKQMSVKLEIRTKEFPQYHFTAGMQMCLLAQNVETVVPEAVSEKDGYKGVDYARLVRCWLKP